MKSTDQQNNRAAEQQTRCLQSRPAAAVCCSAVLLLCCSLCSCLERTITITSKPEGAIVSLNDTEVGRTPVTTAFTYYGEYDVRLRLDGYEPISTHREAAAPIYEFPPFDLPATALPMRIKTNRIWHFDLTPLTTPSRESEEALTARAKEMQAQVAAGTNKPK